jgi:hypothetical protein
MQLLVKKVAEALKRNPSCTISLDEISLIWPGTFEEQQERVRAFAERNGWRLSEFNLGKGALITKRPVF